MNLEKIKKMEGILDKQMERINQLDEVLYEFEKSQAEYEELKEYYFSEEFIEDVESSNLGELPSDLKCGVLSEDAVYDLIGETYHLAVGMLELATKIIRNQ